MHNSTFNFILKEEGSNPHAYQEGRDWKIGAGFSLEEGLLKEEIDFILKNRISLIRSKVLTQLPFVAYMSEARQSVIYFLVYKKAEISKDMEVALKANDWDRAADVISSCGTDETFKRLSMQMRTGNWQLKPDTNNPNNLTDDSMSAKDLLQTLQQ